MIYSFGEYELDTRRYELRKQGTPCHLEPQVFDLLAYLVENRDRIVLREEVIDRIWPDHCISDAALSSRVMAARKALGDSGKEQRYIRTVHGRGFRFVGEVVQADGAGDGAGGTPPLPEGGSTAPDRGVHEPAAVPQTPQAPEGAARDLSAPAEPQPLVGREAELGELDRCLDLALGGRRQAVFVTGESGIGKTTLVNAFLRRAASRQPCWVGVGECLEHWGAGEAYLPLLDALGRMCGGPEGSQVTRLLAQRAPTWLLQMPWLIEEPEVEALRVRALGATRDRMLREMVGALEALALERPVLLLLEDLHWSDHATLDLIAWLGRRREPARLLLVGTYRPADVRSQGHPLLSVQRELQVHGQCVEVRLPFLTVPQITEYLLQRLDGADPPEGLAELLHQRSEGSPLLASSLLSGWLETGVVRQVEGRWALSEDARHLAARLPDSLQHLVAQQLDRLTSEEREVLEAAAVAGPEFQTGTVAACIGQPEEAVDAICEALSRQGRLLSPCGLLERADGSLSSSYAFIHSLYQEAILGQVPQGPRVRLHRRVGEYLEKDQPPQGAHPPAELALHFLRGRAHDKAAQYLQRAAEQALHRSAHREALDHLSAALQSLSQVPETRERCSQELALQAMLASTLVAVKGWSAEEIDRAFARARELCRLLGEPPLESHVLFAMATVHEYRGEYPLSRAILEALVARPGVEVEREAREVLACSTFHQGCFREALAHADRGLSQTEESEYSALLASYGDHPGVAYHDWAAMALWFLGYPDRALERARRAHDLAKEHLYSMANAQVQLAFLHQFRREEALTRQWAEAAIALATEQGFPFRVAQASLLRGWALAAQGETEAGLEELRRGLAAYDATGARLDRPYYLCLLAEVRRMHGEPEAALEALDEATASLPADRRFFYEAEIHRLRGEALEACRRSPEASAACYEQALEAARRQGALSLELRAARDLARLRYQEGRAGEARRLLAEVYDAFEEGHDTQDLRAAAALLRELKADAADTADTADAADAGALSPSRS